MVLLDFFRLQNHTHAFGQPSCGFLSVTLNIPQLVLVVRLVTLFPFGESSAFRDNFIELVELCKACLGYDMRGECVA